MTDNPAIKFFHVWDTYAKVVAGNYMFHRELGDAVHQILQERFAAKAFTILDLGCGDAATFAPLLEGLQIKQYLGADLSDAALQCAKENLSFLRCPVELRQSDFSAALQEAPRQDVIYISFALHHLRSDQKAIFFRHAAQKLTPGGVVIFVDVFREEAQPLDSYHAAYCDFLRHSMSDLNDDEKASICEHITHYDFPDSRQMICDFAEQAGLRLIASVEPHKWHQMLAFQRND